MKEFEIKYREFQAAKDKAEQHMFPFILPFDLMLEKEYEDLKFNYTKEHEELFIKNVNFVLDNLL